MALSVFTTPAELNDDQRARFGGAVASAHAARAVTAYRQAQEVAARAALKANGGNKAAALADLLKQAGVI